MWLNFVPFTLIKFSMNHKVNYYSFLSDSLNRRINEIQSEFVMELLLVLDINYHNPKFTVSELSYILGTNRINLFRRLKEALDINASTLIRVYRLHKARDLILKGQYNLNQISVKSGFANASYFTQCFKEYFGTLPSKYQKYHESKIPANELFSSSINL